MYRSLLSLVVLFCLISFSYPVMAIEKLSSVFYPLPTQAQGKVYSAQNLFIGGEGGVWIHDVHGKVRFFDGQNVLPNQGSILDTQYQQLTYLNNSFWVVVEGALHKTSSINRLEKVAELPLGTKIDKIGVSGLSIWMVSRDYFYTYHTQSKSLETYSLGALSHFARSQRVMVNDAKFGISKWVLATNSGVFLSEHQGFKHIPRSGNDYVETLFFSAKRQEMLIGTLNGVLIVDLKNKQNQPKRVAESHVLSMAETENEYWIGTEDGLFVYSLLSGKTTKLKSNVHHDYSFQGQKIFALVNDFQGGIWVASEKGVFYYSMFGQKFHRYLPKQIGPTTFSYDVISLSPLDDNRYLMTTRDGVYQLTLDHNINKTMLVERKVNDAVWQDKRLWLATDNGLVQYDVASAKTMEPYLPELLKHDKVDRLEVDDKGILWGISGTKLWSYNPVNTFFFDYGNEWIVDAYLPATVTQLVATSNNGVVIGTEHGSYIVSHQKVRFDIDSHRYGKTHSVLEDSQAGIWFAADYGVYRLAPGSTHIQSVPLAEDSISPKCLTETPEGIWLSSSRGITLYNLKGEVKKHFGEPYGLINNEFLPGVCTSGRNEKYPQIIMGSTHGLVKVASDELAVSRLPHSPTIVSQIKVDNELLAVGNQLEFSFDYGNALRLVFGSLPQTANSRLEYRLNNSHLWQSVDGSQLTLDHLRPGRYQLHLRNFNSQQDDGVDTTLSFRVIEPWYLTITAFIGYIFTSILLLLAIFWWRSRLIVKANRLLKEQVNLKTSQLSHQSKVVLSNNLQLRKQIQVRHALLENILAMIDPRLERISVGAYQENNAELGNLAIEARRDLEQVKNIRSDCDSSKLVQDLSLVLESAASSWKHEFSVAGMKIELDIPEDDIYVEINQFNLDVIFNTLLSEAIKRLYKTQTLHIKCYRLKQQTLVVMSDQGVCAHNVAQTMATISGFTLNQLDDLVRHSGGEVKVFSSKEQNVVQLSWPSAEPAQLSAGVEPYTRYKSAKGIDEFECAWFSKVEQLVTDYYADPEFSTATVIKALYMSERSFQRRFKSTTGKTFKEYLNQVRLEKACQRLLSGEKVSLVAYECGFNDPSYFSQRFRHYFGLSPTQFIDENQE